VSNNCWSEKGRFFVGAAFTTVFLAALVFIRSTRLSAGLPPEVSKTF
jgi:hypothetical protein